jgi:glutathione S-transferase
MKLYFAPGTCSMAPHIALREAGLTFELERVDLRTHRTEKGDDYARVNPKGYVPALRLDDGEVLTEAAVVLQYIADRTPGVLAPAFGTMERYRLMEWLSFISTEVHKQFSPFFNPQITPEWKAAQLQRLTRRFDYLAQQLTGRPYLLGDQFTVADAYLFTLLGWTKLFKIDMAQWPTLQEYAARIAARASVQATLKAEGLGGS